MLIHRMYVRWDNTWGRFGSWLSRDDWELCSVIGFLLKQSEVTSSSSLLGRDIPDRSQPNEFRLTIGCRSWDGISLSTSDASNWVNCSLTKYFYNHFWKLNSNTTFSVHPFNSLTAPRINSATSSVTRVVWAAAVWRLWDLRIGTTFSQAKPSAQAPWTIWTLSTGAIWIVWMMVWIIVWIVCLNCSWCPEFMLQMHCMTLPMRQTLGRHRPITRLFWPTFKIGQQ